jgi:hypothetical protein
MAAGIIHSSKNHIRHLLGKSVFTKGESVTTIDYRYADGRFTMSPRGVDVPNHRYLSNSDARVNAGMRRWTLHLPEPT